jgi:hypothetical protein
MACKRAAAFLSMMSGGMCGIWTYGIPSEDLRSGSTHAGRLLRDAAEAVSGELRRVGESPIIADAPDNAHIGG